MKTLLLLLLLALLTGGLLLGQSPVLSNTNAADQRNNFNGWLGFRLTVGPTPLSVSSLGVIRTQDNTSLPCRVIKSSDKSVVAPASGGSVSVTRQLPGPTITYDYQDITPVTLNASTDYILECQYTLGVTNFVDGTQIAGGESSTDITIDAATYSADGSTYNEFGGSNWTIGIPNMKYVLGGTTPPTVTMTAPTNGATVGGTALTLTATATPASGQTIANVQFKLDGSNIGSSDTSSPYTINIDTTAITAGSHSLTATGTQTNAAFATATSVSVTVANKPTAAVSAPSNGATISGTSITFSAGGTVVSGSGRTITQVQLYLDGSTFGSPVSSSTASTSLNTTTLSNASHTLGAMVTDSAGEISVLSNISVTVSNTATVSLQGYWTKNTIFEGLQDMSGSKVIPPNSGTPPTGSCTTGQIQIVTPGSSPSVIYICRNGGWEAFNAAITSLTGCTLPQVAYGVDFLNSVFLCTTPTGSGSGATQTIQLTDFLLPVRTASTLTFSPNCRPGQSCNLDRSPSVTQFVTGPYTCSLPTPATAHNGSICAYITSSGTLTAGVSTSLGSDVTCSSGVAVVQGVDSCPTTNVKQLWTWTATNGVWDTNGGNPLVAAYQLKPSPTPGTGIAISPGPSDTISILTNVVLRKGPCPGGPASGFPSGFTQGDVCWNYSVNPAAGWVCANAAGCTVTGDWQKVTP